jgi:hypothetical protein
VHVHAKQALDRLGVGIFILNLARGKSRRNVAAVLVDTLNYLFDIVLVAVTAHDHIAVVVVAMSVCGQAHGG